VPGNEERLKELHAKEQYLQNDIRMKRQALSSLLEPSEYVEFCFWLGSRSYYAVTEKRLLICSESGLFPGEMTVKRSRLGIYKPEFANSSGEIQSKYDWKEVVAVGSAEYRNNYASPRFQVEVQTLRGSFFLNFNDSDTLGASRIQQEILAALNRHASGQRDIRALIWSLKFD